MFHRERGREFEKCGMRLPTGDQIANRGQAVSNDVLGNHFASYTNALPERHEVRGDEQASAISLRATDRIDHGANGAFAVCSGHVNDASSAKIHMQLCKKSPDVFQAKLDAEALKAVEPGERLFVRSLSAGNGGDIALRCPDAAARRPYQRTRTPSGTHFHGVTAR